MTRCAIVFVRIPLYCMFISVVGVCRTAVFVACSGRGTNQWRDAADASDPPSPHFAAVDLVHLARRVVAHFDGVRNYIAFSGPDRNHALRLSFLSDVGPASAVASFSCYSTGLVALVL